MKIKALLLDFDNTIYPEKDYFVKIFQEFCNQNNIEFSRFEKIIIYFDFFRLTEKDIFKFALVKAGFYSIENHNKLFQLYTEITTNLFPYDGINYLVEKALSNKVEIYILTNGVSVAQRNKWKNLDLNEKDKIFFQPSREMGSDKPCSETFMKMLKIVNRAPEDVIFIGDRYENDLKWGIDNHSKGILYNSMDKNNSIPSFNNAVEMWNFMQTEF